MGDIYGLGYVGLRSEKIEQWRDFATTVLGMQVAEPPAGEEDSLYLRMDERAWRYAVAPGPEDLDYVGWEARGPDELDRLATALIAAGYSAEEAPDLAVTRRVARVVRSADPAGNPVELFCGARETRAPFSSPTGVRFVTGDLGIGHVVLGMPDLAEAKRYYLSTLGFRVSDTHGTTHFCHVNGRHHSLAFRAEPGEPSTFKHCMVEVADLDMVGRTLDIVNSGAAPLANGLGRHSNDQAVSFYVKTPSGFEVEYGACARLVDDGWTTRTYESTSMWGHHRLLPVTGV
ncbi:VOC family protein [Solwaraspora sp. WMMD1047]|uniref:VOC family protein n=1 Tax=Solwaraspora sp. WMMD1047 TaxID=3016102 RepID=UPI002417BC25|nr:VOC family protein [Solwaraspora sp. WMMD1047]MDG4834299.1 VOC family protein [Solwaraspora sp. WMMD1047]